MRKERCTAAGLPPGELSVSRARGVGDPGGIRLSVLEAANGNPALRGGHTVAHRPLDEREDGAGAREPHLRLGRVHVDVDLVRRQPQIDDDSRAAESATRLAQDPKHRTDQQSILDRAAVDQKRQIRPTPPTSRREQAAHLATASPGLEANDLLRPPPQVFEPV